MHTGYELVDPRDNLPFYVGITNDVYKRFKQHIRCNGQNPAKDARIQELQTDQEVMIMRPLFRTNLYHEALELETEWINKYLAQGIQLLNIVGVENPVIVPVKALSPLVYDGKSKNHRRNTDAQIDEILDWYLLTGELPDVSDRQRYHYRHHPRLKDRQRLLLQKG